METIIECPNCEIDFDDCYHDGDFTVSFTGEFYNLTTVVFATNSEEAIRHAITQLAIEYGFDVESTAKETKATLEGIL